MSLQEWRALLLWTAVGGLAMLWRSGFAELLGVLAIALIGTPHGAADILRLRALPNAIPHLRRWPGQAPTVVAATLLYLCATVCVWWAFATWPVFGLLAFIALSLFHFGRTDAIAEGRDGAVPFAAAVVAIAGPFVFWQAEAVRYLGWIGIPADIASRFTPAMAAAIVAGAVAASVIDAFAAARASAMPLQGGDDDSLSRRWPNALWVALPALSLPPAAGFAVYFCALHATRHWQQLREEGIALPRAPILATTAVTLLLGLLALWLSSHTVTFDTAAFGSQSIWAGIAKVLVIGLAALTVPHMLLDAALRACRQSGPR